jgi:hypothetical protein
MAVNAVDSGSIKGFAQVAQSLDRLVAEEHLILKLESLWILGYGSREEALEKTGEEYTFLVELALQ